jgi:hypothetical protein
MAVENGCLDEKFAEYSSHIHVYSAFSTNFSSKTVSKLAGSCPVYKFQKILRRLRRRQKLWGFPKGEMRRFSPFGHGRGFIPRR